MDAKSKLKKFLWGSVLVGGLASGLHACSPRKEKDNNEEKPKTEVKQSKPENDPYGNIALFQNSLNEIKFALAFVENYYPYIYYCGKSWTAGHGLTILYNEDGTYTKVTKQTPVPTISESDAYKERYLTYDILPDIAKRVKVPMDEETLIAACILRYCIGGTKFRKSSFLKQLNDGKTGAELSKTLTGWRKQNGVCNRCYFFAAMMEGKMEYADLLELRAEGCYNLEPEDMFVYSNDKPKCDEDNFYEWDFSKLSENIEKAKKARYVRLNLGKQKGHITIQCDSTKNIVSEDTWQEISTKYKKTEEAKEENKKQQSTKGKKTAAFLAFSAIGAGAVYGRKKYLEKQTKDR